MAISPGGADCLLCISVSLHWKGAGKRQNPIWPLCLCGTCYNHRVKSKEETRDLRLLPDGTLVPEGAVAGTAAADLAAPGASELPRADLASLFGIELAPPACP